MTKIFLDNLQNIANKYEFELIIAEKRYPSLKKKENDRILTVGVGDIFEKKVFSIGCNLLFCIIETHFQSIEEDWTANWNPTIKQFNHTSMLEYEFGRSIYDKLPLNLEKPESVFLIIELIEKFFKQDALPFFNYWEDIRTIIPWLESDYNNFMAMNKVFGNNALLKKCITWYQTSHPEYEKFKMYHKNRLHSLLKKQPNNVNLKKSNKIFNEVLESLEKLQPKFSWDANYLKFRPFKSLDA